VGSTEYRSIASIKGQLMETQGSVSEWIVGSKRGDAQALQRLWQRYYEQLVQLARQQLDGVRRTAADEEDVAAVALARFCQGAKEGRFPKLADRKGLWRLLMRITAQAALDQVKHEQRLRRHAVGESALGEQVDGAGLAAVIGSEPRPELAAVFVEQTRRLLECLDDDELREVVTYRLAGYSNQEIAERMSCSVSKVERCRKLIRKIYERECT
jgi:RNA polymerase sigma factor (sigma-70 family)